MGDHRWLRLGDKLGTLLLMFAGLLTVYVLAPPPEHTSAWAAAAAWANPISGRDQQFPLASEFGGPRLANHRDPDLARVSQLVLDLLRDV
ncbi:MAG TPA: hypothetical protein VGI58_14330, partial [Streptosporangiaceae bacterium]